MSSQKRKTNPVTVLLSNGNLNDIVWNFFTPVHNNYRRKHGLSSDISASGARHDR